MKHFLVTGAAGFIGHHLCVRLLEAGNQVLGVDNLNKYYDPALKQARLALLEGDSGFRFMKLSLEDEEGMRSMFEANRFDTVIHMAAQAGVRYSIENPGVYINSNIVGFSYLLEGCRKHGVRKLVFASSSSVYGANRKLPFNEAQNVDHPVSLYAATKKSNELMAHVYSSLYGLPSIGLRFFTVYGPWGRPDMALFKFTKAILEGEPIDVYNNGDMRRDFTYIDDITGGVMSVLGREIGPDPGWDPVSPSPHSSYAPYRIFNIGNNRSENLLKMIEVLEKSLGRQATKNYLPMQPGDVKETAADIGLLGKFSGFEPSTTIEEGIPRFVKWYREYYQV